MLPVLLAVQLAAARPVGKIDVLKVWISAVEEHRPEQLDDAANQVRAIGHAELDRVRIELRTIIKLMRSPRETIFYAVEPGRESAGRSPALVYANEELTALRDIAAAAARRGDTNRLLKRAAVLHTDLAILAPLDGVPPVRGRRGALQRTTALVQDGRPIALLDAVDHWEMARRILDEIRSRPERNEPDPQHDADVRLWYRATSAYQQSNHLVERRHLMTAVAVFPDDADILFLAGASREMAAAPGVYDTLRQTRGPALNLDSEEAEMRTAESLFRRALAANARHTEARLRLGRVLGRLGRHDDAVKELQAVAASATDPVIAYYAHLFLGRELDAQRDPAGARHAYERAAALHPGAQSPRLALSQLMNRSGDRAASRDLIRETIAEAAIDDPDLFWVYYRAAGRDADVLMTRMFRAMAPEPVP
jgi:tetratricopeptide (TPR) repeat protein